MNVPTTTLASLALATMTLGALAFATPADAGCSSGHGARMSKPAYSASTYRSAPRRAAPRRRVVENVAPRRAPRIAAAEQPRVEAPAKAAVANEPNRSRRVARVVPTAAVVDRAPVVATPAKVSNPASAAITQAPLLRASAPTAAALAAITTNRADSTPEKLCERYLPAVGAIVKVSCTE
jgi:hypothetical protein